MFIITLLVCIAVSVIAAIAVTPQKARYTKLDKCTFVCNIILAVLYIPISLVGIFSVFAADSMFRFSDAVQRIIGILISAGISIPFVSVISISLSVILRKKQKSIWSFIVQFIPLVMFFIIMAAFEIIYQ